MKSISIITVVYNGQSVIEKTIQSVLHQDYPNIEYIIVDGASTDNTHSIIEKYTDFVDVLISEPDEGIYDAMNKGLAMASSSHVLFLNAGDHLLQPDTLSRVAQYGDADIYYGETYLVDDQYKILGTRSELTTRKLPSNLNWKSMKKGLVVCHQSFIVRKEIAPDYIMNNLSADIDWVIRCLKNSKRTLRVDHVISCFLIGGISDQKKWTSLKDRFQVMRHHYGLWSTLFHHIYFILRALAHKITAWKGRHSNK